MLAKAKPICFVATAKPARAKKFYCDILGLELLEETPFALVFDAHETMLRIQKVPEVSPAVYTILGWEVGDIRATIKKLRGKRVRFERYPGMEQDRSGIWTAPGGSLVAWFRDPDGNTLSLTEFRKRRRKS